VLLEALRFVAEPGRFVISPFGHPNITLSHLSVLPGWAESLAGSAALSPGDQEIIEPRCQSFWPEVCLYGGASSTVSLDIVEPHLQMLHSQRCADGHCHVK
jgi:hypothetical protein